MLTLASKAEVYFRNYVRGGGKDNRKKQVSRIIKFLDWVESTQKVISLHSLGKRHVVNFWKAHRELSEATANKYWLGISKLWEWLGKHEEPPKRKPGNLLSKPDFKKTLFSEPSKVIKASREARQLTVQKLANMTGIEIDQIEAIEAGGIEGYEVSLQCLFRSLGIQFSYAKIDN